MLEVTKLSCSRNDRVLFSNLSFSVNPGACLQLCGSNGIGKTTVLKIIAGLWQDYSGKFKLLSEICYVGHKKHLHPGLTPLQNLTYLAALQPLRVDQTAHDVTVALNSAQLAKLAAVPCEDLSAGQLQRINLALLYITPAKLWLLDEPFTNLDSTAKEIYYNLCQQHLTNGGGLIIATHNPIKFFGRQQQMLDLQIYA